jgi:hypothetical protein
MNIRRDFLKQAGASGAVLASASVPSGTNAAAIAGTAYAGPHR